jgi:predicted Fe-Mo cluster-binding NifX family protein
MKIAIASTGNTQDAKIDKHFARCSYFLIYDTVGNKYEFIENKNRTSKENAGLAAVKMMNELNVKRIISGEFGLKVKSRLDELKIQLVVITDHERKIKDIIKLLKTSHT